MALDGLGETAVGPGVGDGFLGVARSETGRRWRARDHDARAAEGIAQRIAGLADMDVEGGAAFLGRVLAARGVAVKDAQAYLDPSLKTLLPDPASLVDMTAAGSRLAAAVRSGERIAIFGDYDVDGATSSALLHRYLKALGNEPLIYIPDRLTEGYGPNGPALRRLAEEGARLVVTVDCGASAHDALAEGAEAGLDIIVVDHHLAPPEAPIAYALVNPARPDCHAGQGHLAAVGVAFLLAVETNRTLRLDGWFKDSREAPDLMRYVDLVALGTVCDVAPLKGVNRAFVRQGLKVMAARGNLGLAALADAAGLKRAPTVRDLGFALGPRVNAGGRIGDADLGARLLTTDAPQEAAELAAELSALNRERQRIERDITEQAIFAVESAHGAEPPPVIVVADEAWSPGVVGIVAARLKARFGRPAVVIGVDEAGIAKGSGRSIPGVDLGQAVIAAREAGLIAKGGGHAMAAGLTTPSGDIPALEAFLNEKLREPVEKALEAPELTLDGALAPSAATPALAAMIERAGPWGAEAPAPRLAIADVRVAFAKPVGTNHLRLSLEGRDGQRLEAIGFGVADGPLGRLLAARDGARLHVAGRLVADPYRGPEAVQLEIDDAARLRDGRAG